MKPKARLRPLSSLTSQEAGGNGCNRSRRQSGCSGQGQGRHRQEQATQVRSWRKQRGIGQLVEKVDWLLKTARSRGPTQKESSMESSHPQLIVRRQGQLLWNAGAHGPDSGCADYSPVSRPQPAALKTGVSVLSGRFIRLCFFDNQKRLSPCEVEGVAAPRAPWRHTSLGLRSLVSLLQGGAAMGLSRVPEQYAPPFFSHFCRSFFSRTP